MNVDLQASRIRGLSFFQAARHSSSDLTTRSIERDKREHQQKFYTRKYWWPRRRVIIFMLNAQIAVVVNVLDRWFFDGVKRKCSFCVRLTHANFTVIKTRDGGTPIHRGSPVTGCTRRPRSVPTLALAEDS